MFLKRACSSPTVSVFLLPDHISADKVINMMKNEYGILISSTYLIKLNGLRIGHMGYTAHEKFVIPTLYALENILNKLTSR